MSKASGTVAAVFNDNGKCFKEVLEQILKVIINSPEDGEDKCIKKKL